MARLDAIRDAERPKMHGRMMISGPSGAGKTWTSLSMATRLANDAGRPGEILVIDTEKESALTYADVFTFKHLPWRAPFDPDELAGVISDLGDRFAVVDIDSFTHFWRGSGGTLSIADGKFGGWKNARPVQDRVVEAVLSMPCHVILCVRSKMDYLVTQDSSKKQEITKVGLAPIQDEDLVYEMNVAMDIDLEHRITVTKSRTAAVPVGRMYPAGMEGKAADDYAEWLSGGAPPASREIIDEIVALVSSVGDAELRKTIRSEFVQTFGMTATLTAAKAGDAKAWVMNRIEGNDAPDEHPDHDPATTPDVPPPDPDHVPDADPGDDATTGDVTDDHDSAPGDAGATDDAGDDHEPPEAGDPPVASMTDDWTPDTARAAIVNMVENAKKMTKATLAAEITSKQIKCHQSWPKATLGRLYVRELAREIGIRVSAGEVPWDDEGGDDEPFGDTPEPNETAGTLGV
jgi:hypothetical protein